METNSPDLVSNEIRDKNSRRCRQRQTMPQYAVAKPFEEPRTAESLRPVRLVRDTTGCIEQYAAMRGRASRILTFNSVERISIRPGSASLFCLANSRTRCNVGVSNGMFSTLKLGVAVLAGVVLILCQFGVCTGATAGHKSPHSCCPSGPDPSSQSLPAGPTCLAANVPILTSDSGQDPVFDTIGPLPVQLAAADQIISWNASTSRFPHQLLDRAIAYHQILV